MTLTYASIALGTPAGAERRQSSAPAALQGLAPGALSLDAAVHTALIYADLFDAPLRADEVHRYLPDVPATLDVVREALALWPSDRGLFHLPGRQHLVDTHLEREDASRRLWPRALRWGQALWNLPFVELVGLTGSLAVRNAERAHDIDFMLVTRPGHLWTVRALAIALVRVARARGVELCPNFLVTTRALALRQRTFFAAHELVQLVPLYGAATYKQLIAANLWALQRLPNAASYLPLVGDDSAYPARPIERWLNGALGARFERWESGRKIPRFRVQAEEDDEIVFSEDECKGHFDRYAGRTLRTFQERVARAEGLRGD